MSTIQKGLRWIFVSSSDASKWSLTVKAALLGAIPVIMQVVHLACGFNVFCLNVDGDLLTQLFSAVANLVYAGLALVASIGVVYGLARKVYLSITGQNAATQ